MVQEILANLYKIDIPLSGSPLRALNAYVIRGADRHLVVDTGWNRRDSMDAMLAGLKKIDVAPDKTDFFITHLHVDHIGLVASLVMGGTRVYFNRKEAASLKAEIPWRPGTHYAVMSGFPEKDVEALVRNHPGVKYGIRQPLAFTLLDHEEKLRVGEFEFTAIETPGHTPGHTCLYEPEKKILLAGDHLLQDITPNIQLSSEDGNPLKDYLGSLDRVGNYNIGLVLPGHGEMFRDCQKRILELKTHHRERLNEIVTILGKGEKSGFQLASEMTWDISHEYKSWAAFPVQQKWFATGEANSHLRYLEAEGSVRKEVREGKIFYGLP